MVIIPYRGNVVHLMNLLPTSLKDKVGSIIGVQNAMDDFKGKGSMKNRIPGLGGK